MRPIHLKLKLHERMRIERYPENTTVVSLLHKDQKMFWTPRQAQELPDSVQKGSKFPQIGKNLNILKKKLLMYLLPSSATAPTPALAGG